MKSYYTKKPLKLLDALKEIYPDSSNKTLRDLLKNKRVLVDNEMIVNANFLLETKQKIEIKKFLKKASHGIEVLYEDSYIIIINKPAGLLSVPLDRKKSINALQILRKKLDTNKIFAVHRIDKDTSGVLMFVKSKKALEEFKKMFKDHLLKRVYLAIVNGKMLEDKTTFKSRLIQLNEYEVKSTNLPEGHLAITHAAVIKRSKNFSFLKLVLKTGKKHQIRVHLKETGHPILGDKKYNDVSKHKMSRMCLHAYLLEFNHSFLNKKMSFKAPVPNEFKSLGFNL